MAQQNNIAQQLNDLLVTRNFHPDMLDAQGKVSDSEDAKTFTFDYISSSGKNYGTMVVILDSDNDVKAFYGDNLGRSMEGDDKNEFFDFQQHLSQFANARRYTYTAKDLGQLKHTMQGLAAIKEGLFEGYYGTRRISYAGEPTEARLMIRHNRNLGENDARFRYVESIFVETADGERYRLPFTNLAGGRAMLEHVRQGGKPYDVRGNHICEMITELKVLTRFNRASQGRVLEGIKQGVVEGAQTYYKSLRESIKRLSSPRGYSAYFESWHPANITEQDQLVEDIKTLFVEQTIDDRIEQALPLLAKIQRGREMKEADIFENWINTLAEGTWSLPETPEQLTRLKTLMSGELIVGPDGTNATEQLYDLIGDDKLFDRISELAQQDPRANLWDDSMVQARMQELGIQMPDNSAPDAMAQSQPAQPPADQDMAEADNISTFESLQRMRHLSGMPLQENVLNDAGSTLDYIMTTYQRDIKDFVQTGDMSEYLYDALYDYYFDDMPYGVKKARTGDPYEWIGDRFRNDLGGADMVDEDQPRSELMRRMPAGGFQVAPKVITPSASQVAPLDLTGQQSMPPPDYIYKDKPIDVLQPVVTSRDNPFSMLSPSLQAEITRDQQTQSQKDRIMRMAAQDLETQDQRDRIVRLGQQESVGLEEGVPGMGAAVRGASELGGKAANAVKGMLEKIPPGHPDYPLLQAARKQEQGNMKVWNKRYPETPWNPDSDTDLLKSFNHDLNVQKGFGQFQRDAMPNDYSPTGYTRAQKSKGAAIDAQNSMQSNQDLFKRAYGIDEADMMNPEIPKDFGSPEHLAHLAGLGKALQSGDRSALGKSNAALAAAQIGQGKTPWEPAPTPSFSTPGAAHAGQGGYDYQDEEPKGQAHSGQGGYNYYDYDDQDQSSAETARLGRAGKVDEDGKDPMDARHAVTDSYYESREGDAMLARIKSLALLR